MLFQLFMENVVSTLFVNVVTFFYNITTFFIDNHEVI
jgi:hypothetical protein